MPVAEVSELESTRKAYETYAAAKQGQRHYLTPPPEETT